jgi:hypothetical protein
MAKTRSTAMGMGGSLKPKLLKGSKRSKVYSFTLPKIGRFAWTSDPGEAKLFARNMISTNLGAILRGPDYSKRGQMHIGPILDEFDLGSGVVTNVGVTALALDSTWFANETENLATLNTLKFMNWGTGTTAAAQTNWRLQKQEVNESKNKEAITVTSSVYSGILAGNAKLIVTGSLEAKETGPVAITEWGLFSAAKTEGSTAKAATAVTENKLTDTAKLEAPGSTESKKNARGAQQYILFAKESEEAYATVVSNTTEVATLAKVSGEKAWLKAGTEGKGTVETATTPSATTKYQFYPVMWDHRVFSAINVEKGNKIEFPYELTIEGGS